MILLPSPVIATRMCFIVRMLVLAGDMSKVKFAPGYTAIDLMTIVVMLQNIHIRECLAFGMWRAELSSPCETDTPWFEVFRMVSISRRLT